MVAGGWQHSIRVAGGDLWIGNQYGGAFGGKFENLNIRNIFKVHTRTYINLFRNTSKCNAFPFNEQLNFRDERTVLFNSNFLKLM